MSSKHASRLHGRSPTAKERQSQSKASTSEQVRPETTSFLFVVNELAANDDPESSSWRQVYPRMVNGHWNPPQQAAGFFAQQPGDVYRWSNGTVTLATDYNWEPRVVVDENNTPYANGTVYGPRNYTQPSYYRAATVFYCNHFDRFLATVGDAGTRDINNETDVIYSWQPLTFFHNDNISYINFAGDQELVICRSASWIDQLLPKAYRCNNHSGPTQGSLAGLLPLIIALIAFSCNRSELRNVLTQDRAWRNRNWRPHQRRSGRVSRRGMVVSVFTDPENLEGSTLASLEEFEDGNKPIVR